MNVLEWQELTGDMGVDDSEHDRVTETGEIEVSNYVYYEFEADVQLFRGIPCDAEIVKMTRYIVDYDNDGAILDTMELDYNDFPHFIVKAAKKKVVEGY